MMNIIKYLQAQGIGSRKLCQELIKANRVLINHVEPSGKEIDDKSVHSITIDDKDVVVVPLPYFYIVLHKPADYETSHKPKQYASVFSLLPDNVRYLDLQAVGRLDADTTGLLIITNDGQFNHQLTSPKYHVAKIYQITLRHAADQALCAQLLKGVLLHDENEVVIADEAQLINPTTLLMTISSGKYHQVKRMIAAAGNRVDNLHRIQFGNLSLNDLPLGQWRWLKPEDVR